MSDSNNRNIIMRQLLFVLILILIVAGCHKESTPETGLTGSWRIVKIDSGFMQGPWRETLHIRQEFSETGEITFNEDSTGFFKNSIRYITCGELDFTWSIVTYETPPILDRILVDLSLPNGDPELSFYTQSNKDSIEFLFGAYCAGAYGGDGPMKYYKFSLVRK